MTALTEARAAHFKPLPNVTVIDPLLDGRWDRFVDRHPNAGPFHHSSWARALVDAYGYLPRYHVVEVAAEIVAAWPAMLVRSRLTGNRLVALPFPTTARL